MNSEDKIKAESVKVAHSVEAMQRERSRLEWVTARPREVLRELAKVGIYWFVNRRELDVKESRKASLGVQMILPREAKRLLSPEGVEFALFRVGKQTKIDATEDMDLADKERHQLRMLLNSTRFHVLEDLVALNWAYVEEKEHKGRKRYLAVVDRDPNMVCEITKEAFKALIETDIVSRTVEKHRRQSGRNWRLKLSDSWRTWPYDR